MPKLQLLAVAAATVAALVVEVVAVVDAAVAFVLAAGTFSAHLFDQRHPGPEPEQPVSEDLVRVVLLLLLVVSTAGVHQVVAGGGTTPAHPAPAPPHQVLAEPPRPAIITLQQFTFFKS